MKNTSVIGYCLQTPTTENFSHVFDNKIPNGMHLATEIENYGLMPDFTGLGYGGHFLNAILEDIFSRYTGVYLSTRSTNHPKVPLFWQDQGFTLSKSETLHDDIKPQTQYVKVTPNIGGEKPIELDIAA
jgi:ribosomal protein S18 acetylase RimI-like enzyme